MFMAEPTRTLEGWYALHDFRTVDWAGWRSLGEDERRKATEEFVAYFEAMRGLDPEKGSSALFAVGGHKADLLWLHLRPTFDELFELEQRLSCTRFGEFLEPSYSFLSVTELGQYTAEGGAETGPPDPRREAFLKRRLYPQIPPFRYVSFYPMSKRREPEYNWYTLPLEDRRRMMHEHGEVGRRFAGEVQQMITGAMGFDDWEWGVTLHANDPLPIKKVVQEMRFDEASAKYAEFGSFFFGVQLLEATAVEQYLAGEGIAPPGK